MDLFSLKGKRALVVGREGNFGPVFIEALEEAGCEVFAAGLPEYDIGRREDVLMIVRDMAYALNAPPDIIVCNAAVDIPPKQKDARFFTRFEEILRVNLISYGILADNLLDILEPGAVFVFIGSIQGYIGADWRNYEGGFEKPVGYNLSKSALQQLARSITVQYGRRGIRAVCPGFGPYLGEKLAGPFADKIKGAIPMGEGVSRYDLKRTLLYACCCGSLAGEDWLVDGGYTKW